MSECPTYPAKRRFATKQEAKEAARLGGFGVGYYYCGRKGCGGYHIGHKHKFRGKNDKKPRLKRKRREYETMKKLVKLARVILDNWQEQGMYGHCNYCYRDQPSSMHRLTRDEQVHDDDCPVHLAREVIEEHDNE